jgi:hypothetical protein
VPEHIHPLDGAAWRRAILDYASDRSPARSAQLARLASWRRPDWDAHFEITDTLLGHLVAEPRGISRRFRNASKAGKHAAQVAAPQPCMP